MRYTLIRAKRIDRKTFLIRTTIFYSKVENGELRRSFSGHVLVENGKRENSPQHRDHNMNNHHHEDLKTYTST
jgi:hypothetical protein